MSAILPSQQTAWLDNNGKPLAFGYIDTCLAGTSIPKTVWTSAAMHVALTNPISLDENGKQDFYGVGFYRLVVKDSAGTIVSVIDNVGWASGNVVIVGVV
jgi:hypothetical protein